MGKRKLKNKLKDSLEYTSELEISLIDLQNENNEQLKKINNLERRIEAGLKNLITSEKLIIARKDYIIRQLIEQQEKNKYFSLSSHNC